MGVNPPQVDKRGLIKITENHPFIRIRRTDPEVILISGLHCIVDHSCFPIVNAKLSPLFIGKDNRLCVLC